jgi:7-cyano-7-deazaguanine synthase
MIKRQMMVVLSGGQDSTTCLAWAKDNAITVRAVTFNYGQRHQAEIESASKIAQMLGAESHDIIDVPNILRSRSPLTSDTELETYDDYESMDEIIGDRVEVTFVPMRNAFFLTLAANIALAYDCYDLVTGVCQQDNANYPDCRGSFIDAQEATINEALGLSAKFEIHTPLLDLTKAESIALAKSLPGAMDALAYSHTCYAGEVPPCGKCHACVLRAHGFTEAQTSDPLIERFK